jgi:hypothetical protein
MPKPPCPIPNTYSRRPPWPLIRRGLMDWYLVQFRYRSCIWGVEECTKLRLVSVLEVHQKYKRYILNPGG